MNLIETSSTARVPQLSKTVTLRNQLRPRMGSGVWGGWQPSGSFVRHTRLVPHRLVLGMRRVER